MRSTRPPRPRIGRSWQIQDANSDWCELKALVFCRNTLLWRPPSEQWGQARGPHWHGCLDCSAERLQELRNGRHLEILVSGPARQAPAPPAHARKGSQSLGACATNGHAAWRGCRPGKPFWPGVGAADFLCFPAVPGPLSSCPRREPGMRDPGVGPCSVADLGRLWPLSVLSFPICKGGRGPDDLRKSPLSLLSSVRGSTG